MRKTEDTLGDRLYTALITPNRSYVFEWYKMWASTPKQLSETTRDPARSSRCFASNRVSANPSRQAQLLHGAAQLPLPKLYELPTDCDSRTSQSEALATGSSRSTTHSTTPRDSPPPVRRCFTLLAAFRQSRLLVLTAPSESLHSAERT